MQDVLFKVETMTPEEILTADWDTLRDALYRYAARQERTPYTEFEGWSDWDIAVWAMSRGGDNYFRSSRYVYESVSRFDSSRQNLQEPESMLEWWLCESQPIHWLRAALIALEAKK